MADQSGDDRIHQALRAALDDNNPEAARQILMLLQRKAIGDQNPNDRPVLRPDSTLHLSKGGRFADSQGNPIGYNSVTGQPMEEPSSVRDVNEKNWSQVQRAKEIEASNPEWLNQAIAAGGAGMEGMGGLARFATGGTLVSPEDLKQEKRVLAPFEKGRGLAELTGQVLAPMPGKGAETLAGRVLPGALARIAGRTTAGAIQGAAQGDPDKPLSSAAVGAAASGVSQLLNKGGDAALHGVVEHVPGAKGLIEAAKDVGQKIFIPITEASAQVGNWFPRAIANLTQNRGETTRNLNVAKDVARNVIAAHSVPREAPFPVGDTPLAQARDVTQKYNEYLQNAIGSNVLKTDAALSERPMANRFYGYMQNMGVPHEEALQIANSMDQEIMRNSNESGSEILGGNYHFALQNIDKELKNRVTAGFISPQHAESALTAARSILQENLAENQGVKGGERIVRDLSTYIPASTRWNNEIEPWVNAAERNATNEGKYSFSDLAASSPIDSKVTRDMAETAAQVLKKPSASGGTLAEIADRTISHPVKSVLGLTLGNIGANPGVQKALYGDTGMQKAMQSVLKQYPELGNLFSGLSQRGAVAGAEDATGQ